MCSATTRRDPIAEIISSPPKNKIKTYSAHECRWYCSLKCFARPHHRPVAIQRLGPALHFRFLFLTTADTLLRYHVRKTALDIVAILCYWSFYAFSAITSPKRRAGQIKNRRQLLYYHLTLSGTPTIKGAFG